MVTLFNSSDLNIASGLLVDQESLWQLATTNTIFTGDRPTTVDDLSNAISNLEISTVTRINSQVVPVNPIDENSLLLPTSAAYAPFYSGSVSQINQAVSNNTPINNVSNSQQNYDPITNYTQATNDIQIDALLGPNQWNLDALQHQITYCFPTSTDIYTDQIPANVANLHELSEETKRKTRLVFAELEKIIPIDFVEVAYTNSNPGEIVLLGANFTDVCGGYTYYPGEGMGGNVFFNDISCQSDWGYELIPHEIGHALGLKHPGDYGNAGEYPYLTSNQDNTDWTVMSYNVGQQPINASQASLYKKLDISALQYLYA